MVIQFPTLEVEMFDKLFRSRAVVQRHLSSPLLQGRLEYLQHCANQGYSLTTLRELAADLLLIQNLLGAVPGGREPMGRSSAPAL